MKRNLWTIVVALALISVLGVYTICFTVSEGTSTVVYRLGRIVRIKNEPGLGFKYPWPFETAEKIDNRIRMVKVEAAETATGDAKNNLFVTIELGWKVRSNRDAVKKYLTKIQSTAQFEQILKDRISNARQSVIQKYKLRDFVNISESQAENFTRFENDILNKIQEDLDSTNADYGIEIAFLKVPFVKFPEEVTKAVTQRMIKERETISKELIAQGKDTAEKIRNDAKLYRTEKIKAAEGDAIRIKGEGDAQAAEYYKTFKKNPKLANFLRRLDAKREVLKGKSTIVLPADKPLQYLLDEVPEQDKK